jgi:acyl-CoA dehydrogenase
MDFEYSERTRELQFRLRDFMERYVVPHIPQWHREVKAGQRHPDVVRDLKALAKDEGLWNLFLPGLREDEPGTRVSNLEYAPLAEIMGRIHWASEVFNCNAPDTGNMELLHMFANAEQREQWLLPLLEGETRSCFAMTEPDVASSDATNIQTIIRREGEDYIVNGRKWFITNAAHPNTRLVIVLGLSDPDGPSHSRHSQILVPIDAPGLEIVRDIPIMHHYVPEGQCEIVFRDVRLPAANLLGQEGDGFLMAQARLGPGRIHHCMRSIGQCELALELMRERALDRRAFGKPIAEQANIAEWIARSRLEIEQARLLVLKTAWMIDNLGAKAARQEIALIKVLVPKLQTTVIDRAIQIFGAMGLSPDTPLAYLWTWGRALEILDGPTEVHLRTIARYEFNAAKETLGEAAAYMLPPEALMAE